MAQIGQIMRPGLRRVFGSWDKPWIMPTDAEKRAIRRRSHIWMSIMNMWGREGIAKYSWLIAYADARQQACRDRLP